MQTEDENGLCRYCGAGLQELALPDQSRPWKSMLRQHRGNCAFRGGLGLYEAVDVLVRPSWDEIFIQFAHELSKRSSCSRLQVGCVVASGDNQRILAMGYNGDHRGGSNRCDTSEPGSCGCVHGEMNCLVKLNTPELVRKVMYLTDSPCKMCAKLIVNAGIDEVIYDREYRLDEGLVLLRNAGVQVRKFVKE